MITTEAFHPLHSLVSAELRSGEQVLWIGQPDAKRSAMQLVALFIFAIPWTILSLVGFFSVADRSWFAVLFQIPFVLIGVFLMCMPLVAYSKAKQTVYALTNSRILVIEGGKSKTVSSYENINLNDIKRIERANESGDLIFAQKQYKNSDGDERTADIKFVGVPDVRQVESLVRSTFGRELGK